MKIAYIILQVIVWGAFLFCIGRNIVRIPLTAARGKKFGILKAYINPRAIIVMVISLGIMSVFICFAAGRAAEANGGIAEWEQLKGTEYTDYYTEYYNELLAGGSGVVITDFDKFVDEQTAVLRERSDSYVLVVVWLSLMALMLVTDFIGRVFYFTESGCIGRGMKKPEEIFIKRNGGRLDVYFELARGVDPEKRKPFVSLKSTPDNLAKLGGFIEWEEENGGKEAEEV